MHVTKVSDKLYGCLHNILDGKKMTGCLYISPYLVPALIADNLVSISSIYSKESNHEQRFFGFYEPFGLIGTYRLARKIYILNECAIAVSGFEPNIKSFLVDVRDQIEIISKSERPMRVLGEMANNTNFGLPQYEQIGIIGVLDIGNIIHHCAQNGSFETNNLGICASIGSGSDDLRDFTLRLDSVIDNGRMKSPLSAEEFIRGTASAHSSDVLLNQLFENELDSEKRSWGGFMEYVVYKRAERRWCWGPKRIHLFYQTHFEKGKLVCSIVPACFAYDPSDIHGRLLAIQENSGGNAVVKYFTLQNILSEDPDSVTLDEGSFWEFWGNWKPQFATVTFIRPSSMIGKLHSIKSTDPWHEKQIIFDVDQDRTSFGLSQSWLDEAISEIEEIWFCN